MTRKIACVTGTRADYGYLRPVMKKIEGEKELELITIATGMHLFEKFGNTIEEVEKDFPDTIRIPLKLPEDTGEGTAKYVAEGITKLSEAFSTLSPDLCLFIGDRTEAFAGVQAAAYQNIPIAHLQSGDTSTSGLDELMRHSITKFANIHFPATEQSAERVFKMGEEHWRVHMVGSSALDEIPYSNLIGRESLFLKYGLDPEKSLAMVVQHPATFQRGDPSKQIKATIDAVLKTDLQPLVLYPNVDNGGQEMIREIRKYGKKINSIPSLPREDYFGLLNEAAVLVGNSSSGMIESSSFKIPVVNIGARQVGRERGKNVIDVVQNSEEIYSGLNYVLTNKDFRNSLKTCINPYGDGRTSERVCRILKETKINEALLKKQMTY